MESFLPIIFFLQLALVVLLGIFYHLGYRLLGKMEGMLNHLTRLEDIWQTLLYQKKVEDADENLP